MPMVIGNEWRLESILYHFSRLRKILIQFESALWRVLPKVIIKVEILILLVQVAIETGTSTPVQRLTGPLLTQQNVWF